MRYGIAILAAIVIGTNACNAQAPGNLSMDSSRYAAPGDYYLSCDFSKDNWKNQWRFRGKNISIKEEDGKRYADLRTDNRGHYVDLRYRFKDHGKEEPEELYIRYRMKFEKDLLAMPGGKWIGFGGTYDRAGWGGRKVNGRDGWSARGAFHIKGDKIQLGFYCYHADMRSRYGNTWNFKQLVEAGRWYTIELYCKLNTAGTDGGLGKKNGILRAWIDGKPVFEKTDIRFRHASALKIQDAWFNFGTGKSPASGIHLYLDDAAIAKKRIGPVGSKPGTARKVARRKAEPVLTASGEQIVIVGNTAVRRKAKAAPAADDPARKLFKEAEQLFVMRQKGMASERFDKLIAKFPDSRYVEKSREYLKRMAR